MIGSSRSGDGSDAKSATGPETVILARSAVGATPAARLKKRADFVRTARGARNHTGAFTLQALRRPADVTAPGARIGLTVTRKTGGAVERNRMRRRLKEALRQIEDLPARTDHDYVLVLRRPALTESFGSLQQQLVRSFDSVHKRQPKPDRAGGKEAGPR